MALNQAQPTSPNLVIRPGKYPLVLGAVEFSSEECPAKFSIGAGEQMLVVHSLPGGGRVVQDFGNSATEIRWQSRFYGPNVSLRVKQLREYRVSGQPQTLSWRDESYLVKIKSFDPGYKAGYAEYDITLVVINDYNGAFAIGSPADIDDEVQALQNQASIQNSGILAIDPTGAAGFQSQLTNVLNIIAQYLPLAQNIVPGAAAITGAIQGAISAIFLYQESISGSSRQWPYVLSLISTLNAIALNVQQGGVNNSLSLFGGDLFTTASQQYADITHAFTLAQANGRVYPLLNPGITRKVKLPALVVSL